LLFPLTGFIDFVYNLFRMRENIKFTYRQVLDSAQTLGLGESATLAEIKEAYRDLARSFHPDMGEDKADPERFLKISHAYNVLLEYARFYRIEFTEEAYLKRYPEEKLRRRFYSDPIWGPGKPDRDEESQ
jgi:preprotein translocase subunit Sec63